VTSARGTLTVPMIAGAIIVGAVRVTLGILWLSEGILKYRANFGPADILLVAGSADSNVRVPDYFKAAAAFGLHGWPELFGSLAPLTETVLGVILILGVLTRPAAIAGIVLLLIYWSADQLTTQYPVMVALGVIVIVWPRAAARLSLTTALVGLWCRRKAVGPPRSAALRDWL
jgi:thiosulfate dehydrogenase [quinone] large subunit